MKQEKAAIEVLQWFFDLDTMVKACNWPVDVAALVEAKQRLDSLVAGKEPADKVANAYMHVASAIGPNIANVLLESDDAFPEINHSGQLTPPSSGKVTLYVDPSGRRVLAECPSRQSQHPVFSVE